MIKRILAPFFCALLFVSGPASAKETSPKTIPGAKTVSVDEAKALFEKGVPFVDSRSDADWNAGRIPGAVHLNLKKTFNKDSLMKVAAQDKEVVIYCNGPSCLRSSEGCKKAVSWGWKKVYFFRTGFPSWKKAGNPVE
jgi:rhodanese-related sulfurtransferase